MPDPDVPAHHPRGASPSSTDVDPLTAFDARRADALAYLASGVLHDLANPLGAITTFASLLTSDARLPADLRADAELLRGEANRTNRLVRTLLEFARARPASEGPVEVGALLDELLDLEGYALTDVEVERAVEADLPLVETDASRLRHVLLVLGVAALESLGERPLAGSLAVTARATEGGIMVGFETRRAAAREAGPAWARMVAAAAPAAAALDASVDVERREDGGRIVLVVPLVAGRPVGALRGPAVLPATATPVRAVRDARTTPAVVLVCDDEAAIRALLARVLERDGVRVIQATDGPEALEALAETPVDVVVTDLNMAGMSGIDLYEQATADRPHLRSRFVLMTGEPDADDVVRFAAAAGVTVLPKPFDLHAVAASIRDLLRE